jgi:hypothetical protein
MHPSQRTTTPQQQRVCHYAANTDSGAMFTLLPKHGERLLPPTERLSMFLAQVLSADGICRQAVHGAMVKRVISGMEPGKTNTGGYCKARARLPRTLVATLALQTGAIVAEGAVPWWHWQGRQVRLVDGAAVTLPDTEKNQAAYPQSSSQEAGLSFPLCRVVALLAVPRKRCVAQRRNGPMRRQG